ncbi:hypothetical protein RJ55_07163 [Drechmeria coniospora]|nr:hypothetical protein RJ55_07163 [Drechmeria coniospora]
MGPTWNSPNAKQNTTLTHASLSSTSLILTTNPSPSLVAIKMPSPAEVTMPAMRRTRKSIGAYTDTRKAMDKENATVDLGSTLAANRKKSRSKSMGPGGLDALKHGNGNRRASLAAPIKLPRSILKPALTSPLEFLPLKKAPQGTERAGNNRDATTATTSSRPGEDSNGSKIAIRTEEEQQAAAREREERERRDARRKSLANRRVSFAAEATLHTFHEVEEMQDSTTSTDSTRRASSLARSSLGGSVAGTSEETFGSQGDSIPQSPDDQKNLHERKRRRSSGLPPIQFGGADDDTIASTIYSSDSEPADAVEDIEEDEEEEASSSDSDDGTMMTIEAEEMTGVSVASERSVATGEDSTLDEALRMAAHRAGTQRSGSQADDELDDGEEAIPSFGWIKKPGQSTNASAASGTSTQQPHHIYEEEGDGETEMEMDVDVDVDMEMTHAVGRILRPSRNMKQDQDGEMSMDVTQAYGGILDTPTGPRHADTSGEQEETTVDDATMEFTTIFGGIHRPRSPVQDDIADNEDMSMELTTVMGGVLGRTKGKNEPASRRRSLRRLSKMSRDDDAMDLTVGVGCIMNNDSSASHDALEDDATMGMDMTAAVGGIIMDNQTTPHTPTRRSMDEAVEGENGSIGTPAEAASLASPSRSSPRRPPAIQQAGASPERDELFAFRGHGLRRSIVDSSQGVPKFDLLSRTPSPAKLSTPKRTPVSANKAVAALDMKTQRSRTPSPVKPSTPKQVPASADKAVTASQTASLRSRTPSPVKLSTPKRAPESANKEATLMDSPRSRTPSPVKLSTPKKTPAFSNQHDATAAQMTSPRSGSRKKPQADMAVTTPSSAKRASRQRNSLFEHNAVTGTRTPTIILSPQRRELSGLGADRSGLGSPQVAALFDRRGSLGESSSSFVLGRRTVAFEDPNEPAEEDCGERREGDSKESRGKIMERETDGCQEDKDATFNLREMINSLSPKRKPLKGRKSLHVGSAMGLLGKRPAELDDEEAEDDETGKRLKGRQESPVKRIKLQQPPSKAETTGRLTRSARKSLEHGDSRIASSPSSPLNGHVNALRVKDGDAMDEVGFHNSRGNDDASLEEGEEKIHLQDFLDMTSIRFMELTTTKRRHTIAPGSLQDGTAAEGDDGWCLERCVVAGACTVPMLELYQHSCRELKKYISEGRRMVKEIENDTFEENPPLFREYISASPDVKALMDNQFKNVKSHARLLSKAMWYEWRMKLQDGLKEGLINIAEGMTKDDQVLQQQEELLAGVLPDVVARHQALEEECGNLEEAAQELADCDPAELEAARKELSRVESDIAEKKKLIGDLRQALEKSTSDVEALRERKQECVQDIEKSERTREECRGWTSGEVNALKDGVDTIERQHGWAVTGLIGTTLSMTYRRETEVVFDVASFQPHQPSCQIDLWYIADEREHKSQAPRRAEREVLLQCIRDHIRALPQGQTKIRHLLDEVRDGWDKARLVSSRINRVHVTFPTTVIKTSDSSVAMTSSLLLPPIETRVEVTLHLHGRSTADRMDVGISAEAKVVYGEHFNLAKIVEFLMARIGPSVTTEGEDWSKVMVELQQRLIARGKK